MSIIDIWVEADAQWVDSNDSQWEISGDGTLKQIWSDDYYVYAATDQLLNIIDIDTESKIAYITRDGGFTTVWANNDRVYLGTSDDSIKYFNKTVISGSIEDPYDLSLYLNSYNLPYSLSASGIKYMHGYDDKFLVCVTDTEVDVYGFGGTTFKSSSTTVSGNAYKCFMTSTGKFYYTLSGTEWSVERLNCPFMDWTSSNNSYTAGGAIIGSGVIINDIFVTENTSSNRIYNTLFIATSSGVYIIDEETNDYKVIYTTGG
jgi:hypothetical protein